MGDGKMELKRLQDEISMISSFTSTPAGIYRLAYSMEERKAINYLKDQFEEAGMDTWLDAVGNLIARRAGEDNNLPAVAMGSHIDSVYDAGKFDGVAGVVSALEVIRLMNKRGVRTLHPIEVIVFACEESSRFGMATIGSKAMVGTLEMEKVKNLTDKDGMTFAEVLKSSDLDLEDIKHATRMSKDLKSFIEIHIEQGPVLEQKKLDIGIVSAIAGPIRFRIVLKGRASHSGTTPMEYRKDALLGASEIALELEKAAKEEKTFNTVGTVGVLSVLPGGMNIVPGETRLDVDIRGTNIDSRQRVVKRLHEAIEQVELKRGIKATVSCLTDEEPVEMNSDIIQHLKKICEQLRLKSIVMPSGAGHDAMNMAKLCPSGLIFIPSKDGLSHNPEEYTAIEQIGNAMTVLWEYILENSVIQQSEERSYQ